MSDWKNVCFECVDRKAEVRDLRIRIADCEGAIERREQFIAEANSERDAAKDAEVVAWGEVDALSRQLEQTQTRVTELADALHGIAVALKDAGNLSKEMHDVIVKATQGSSDAWLLRKQADAVERFGQEIGVFDPEYDDQGYVEIPRREVKIYAQHLRQQADEIEKAGGDDV